MKEAILFSIIMPVFNRKKIVDSSIESVLKQTYSNWELLVIDDCSTDGTVDKLEKISALDNRVRVFQTPVNSGPSTARNIGLDNIKGDYVCFLDSDDKFSTDALEVLSMQCSSDPDMVIFDYANCKNINDYMQAKRTRLESFIINKNDIDRSLLPQHLNVVPPDKYYSQPYTWNKAFKANILRQNKIHFDDKKRMWEDGEFVIACMANSRQIIRINNFLIYVDAANPKSNDHLSQGYDRNLAENFLKQYKKLLGKWGNKYDFFSEYAIRRNYNSFFFVLVLTAMKDSQGRRAKIINVLNDMAAQKVMTMAKPLTFMEKILRRFLLGKHVYAAYVTLCIYALCKNAYGRFKNVVCSIYKREE
ncbi:MAG: glycosyltransferase family 2 protein [Victivallales bacterium]|nr:glycosyltransferase family 2 protein [Victivallales bacterium]